MNAPIAHHFIPAFILAQWADGSGKLVEYTIKHDKVIAKPVGPRATGYEQHLYSFPELPSDAAHFLEAVFFNYADRVAADALRNPCGTGVATQNHRDTPPAFRIPIGPNVSHPLGECEPNSPPWGIASLKI